MHYDLPKGSNYKTFLCYRRPGENTAHLAASENIAGVLHWWLNYNPIFAQKGPALFEECGERGRGMTYDEAAIRSFMPLMETFIVAICPGFFDKVLAIYDELDDQCETKTERIEKTRARLFHNSKGDLCYVEMKYAMENNCNIIPIFVTAKGKTAESSWKAREAQLKNILGDLSSKLFCYNNTYTVNYDKLAAYLKDVHWCDIEPTDVGSRMEALEKEEEGQKLLKWLQQELRVKVKAGPKPPVDADTLLGDLHRCSRTFLDLQQPGEDARQFCAGNRKLVYDPVRSRNIQNDPEVRPPFLADCLVESFLENKKAFGLQSDTFRYWNVNLIQNDAETQQPESIPLSVCAVCFGTLSVYHYLHKEGKQLEVHISDETKKPLLDTIQSGLNLLLALRNPYTKTWPSTWEFNNKEENFGTEGTTNQTTLSLSTLMSCGFLSADIAPDFLKARYDYIWESVNVLLSWGMSRTDIHGRMMGWCYTQSKKHPVLLPTVFVFDTLCKLRQCVCALIFCGKFQNDKCFAQRMQKDLLFLEETLNEILAFFKQKQCKKSGKFSGAFRRFEETEYSATHTAYVIKSLYQYLQDHGDKARELATILDPAAEYLVNRLAAMQETEEFSLLDHEWLEDFCDPDPYDNDNDGLKSTYGEKYEHCAEMIIGEALIKIAENTRDAELNRKVMELLQWMFGIYNDEKSDRATDGETVRVRGVRDFLPFPIYGLYYYRMFLWDYLLLLGRKETVSHGEDYSRSHMEHRQPVC